MRVGGLAARRPARPPARRAARLLSRMAAGALALAIVIAAAAWLKLRDGPLDLSALGPRVADAATSALGGARLSLATVSFTLGDALDPRPGLRFTQVRVVDARGAALFASPEVGVALRPADMLLGRLRPVAVTLSGPWLRLVRQADGGFRLGVGDAGPEEAQADSAAEPDDDAALAGAGAAIAALAAGAPGPLEALEEVSINDARLIYDDFSSGRRWRAQRADLRVTRRDGALRAVAALTLARGAQGRTILRAEGERAADGGATMQLNFSGVSPRELVDQFPALAGLEALDAAIEGGAAVAIDASGRLRAFDATLRAASGALVIGQARARLGGGSVAFSLDPDARAFTVRRFALDSEFGALSGAARVDVDVAPDGGARGVTVQADLDALTLSPEGLFAAPAVFDAAALSLRATLDPPRFEVAAADLRRGAAHLRLRGDATLTPAGWRGEGRLAADGLTAADIVALWPLPAAPGAREWLAENLEAGRIDDVAGFARLGPDGPDGALTFAFRDARAHFFRPLPPIEDAAGWGEVDPKRFTITLDRGAVRPPGGGAVDVAGSTMTLPDLDDPLSTSLVDVRGAGPLPTILEVLDSPPLGFVGALGLAPRDVQGDATATASMTLPLLKDLRLDQIAVDVRADLTGVALSPPGLGVAFSQGVARLRADTASLSAEGTGRIDGAPLSFTWVETFEPAPGAAQSRFELAGRIDAARLARFGLDPRPWLEGEIGAEATVERLADGAARVDAALDLDAASLSAGRLAWRKPAGRRGRATVQARLGGDGGASVPAFTLASAGLNVGGSARIGAGGALESLRLTRLTVDRTIDLGLNLTREGAGYRIEADGALFDAAALAQEDASRPDDAPDPALTGSLRLDLLRLTPTIALRQAAGTLSLGADGARRVALSGALGGARVQLDVRENAAPGAPARARLTADDAGALLRGAGLFDDGVGGALAADADVTFAPGLVIDGELGVEGMTITDDPALKRILAETAGAPGSGGAPATVSGVRFDTIRAPFRLTAQRLTLDEAVAYGPSVGLSVSGDYDIAADVLDMRGVFSPAFALNAAIGAIPLLGDILTGGEGRGVVAFNFAARGPAGDPDVTVNPLSVLTPGVLRRLFEGRADAPLAQREPDQRD